MKSKWGWKRIIAKTFAGLLAVGLVVGTIVVAVYVLPRFAEQPEPLRTTYLPLQAELIVHVDVAAIRRAEADGHPVPASWLSSPFLRDLPKSTALPEEARSVVFGFAKWDDSPTYRELAQSNLLIERPDDDSPDRVPFGDVGHTTVQRSLLGGLGLVSPPGGPAALADVHPRVHWTAVVSTSDDLEVASEPVEVGDDVVAWVPESGRVVLGNEFSVADAQLLGGEIERAAHFGFLEDGHDLVVAFALKGDRRTELRRHNRGWLAAVAGLPPEIKTLAERIDDGTAAVGLSLDFGDTVTLLVQLDATDARRASNLEDEVNEIVERSRVWFSTPAAANSAADIAAAFLAEAVVSRQGSTIHVEAELPGGRVQPLVDFIGLALWGYTTPAPAAG